MSTPITDATGTVEQIATDAIAGVVYQLNKLVFGDAGFATQVSTANPLPISDAGGALTVDGTVAVSSGPAASRTTDSLTSTLSTDALMSGLVALAPQFAKISTSSSGATTVVTATASKKIRVVQWSLVCAAAVNVKWQSHVTPTDLTGLMDFAANGGIAMPFSPIGYFETIAGEALDINLSGAIVVGGALAYVLI